MCQNHKHRLTRRDFIKLTGVALGGASLACGRSSKIIELTAVPSPVNPAAQSIPTLVPGQVADTILVNGNIVTMDAKRATAKALAIKDGIVQFVGDDQAVRNMAGDSSQVIDLSGRTVTPGLIDAHCHLSACGLLGTAYVDLSWPAVFTIERYAGQAGREDRQHAAAGSGWSVRGG